MKKQRETLTGKFCKERTLSIASLIFMFFTPLPPQPLTSAECISPSHPVILFMEKDCVCGRFLSVASLQGLIHEGTVTSLCMAMTEVQHESVIIDCSGAQPQFHNAGELQPWKLLPGALTNLFPHWEQTTQTCPSCLLWFYMFIPRSPKTIVILETWKACHA